MWQVPQLMVLSALKAFSQNSRRPNSTPSTVVGLSGGMSIGGKKGGMSISSGVAPGGTSQTTGSGSQAPSRIATARRQAPTVNGVLGDVRGVIFSKMGWFPQGFRVRVTAARCPET